MGLTVAIGNALSGLKASQSALEVISRNISNAGTPGYHKQTLNVVEVGRGDNSYVRAGQVDRAFDSILQNYYTKQVPETAYSATRATFLDRMQTALGMPGSAGPRPEAGSVRPGALPRGRGPILPPTGRPSSALRRSVKERKLSRFCPSSQLP